MFPPDAGAKHYQRLPHESPEWAAVYRPLRSTVEGFNGFTKDGSFEDFGNAAKRRVRGVAAQTIFAAFLLFASNLRKIESFYKVATLDTTGTLRRPSRRQTRSIRSWQPATSVAERGPPRPRPAPAT